MPKPIGRPRENKQWHKSNFQLSIENWEKIKQLAVERERSANWVLTKIFETALNTPGLVDSAMGGEKK